MAELIPLEFRFEASRRRLISTWVAATALTALVAGASLAYAYNWKARQAATYSRLSEEFRAKSVLMSQAKELQTRRLELAARMQKMQELKDDKILLALLRNVSDAFSENDSLEYISVQAHAPNRGNPPEPDDKKYSVHMTGITRNNGTHADLLNRMTELGAKADPPVVTTPESLHREPLLKGDVMRFQIVCDKPDGKRG
jgi:hypothetical protein